MANLEALQTGEDCARIEVDVSGRGAIVTFVTRDGRLARRSLDGPSELLSTLEALQETGDMAVSSEPDDNDDQQGRKAPTRGAQPYEGVPTSALDAVPFSFQPIFSLGLGIRGGADQLVSPTLEGTVALDLQHWHVGVHLGVEFQYLDRNNLERSTGTSLTSGLFLGRRQPLTSMVIHYGARLLYSTSSNEAEQYDQGGDREETRAGLYLGVAGPRRSAVRFRADLAADIVPLDLGGAGLPSGSSTPWWAVSMLLGVEFGGAR